MSFKIRKINKFSFNKQLILPLSFKSIKNRENFIISSSNDSAVKLVENFNYWQKNTISAAIIFDFGSQFLNLKLPDFLLTLIFSAQIVDQ